MARREKRKKRKEIRTTPAGRIVRKALGKAVGRLPPREGIVGPAVGPPPGYVYTPRRGKVGPLAEPPVTSITPRLFSHPLSLNAPLGRKQGKPPPQEEQRMVGVTAGTIGYHVLPGGGVIRRSPGHADVGILEEYQRAQTTIGELTRPRTLPTSLEDRLRAGWVGGETYGFIKGYTYPGDRASAMWIHERELSYGGEISNREAHRRAVAEYTAEMERAPEQFISLEERTRLTEARSVQERLREQVYGLDPYERYVTEEEAERLERERQGRVAERETERAGRLAQRQAIEEAEATGDVQRDADERVIAEPRELANARTGQAPLDTIKRFILQDGQSQRETAVRERVRARVEGLEEGTITPTNDTERAYAAFYEEARTEAERLARVNRQDPTAAQLKAMAARRAEARMIEAEARRAVPTLMTLMKGMTPERATAYLAETAGGPEGAMASAAQMLQNAGYVPEQEGNEEWEERLADYFSEITEMQDYHMLRPGDSGYLTVDQTFDLAVERTNEWFRRIEAQREERAEENMRGEINVEIPPEFKEQIDQLIRDFQAENNGSRPTPEELNVLLSRTNISYRIPAQNE